LEDISHITPVGDVAHSSGDSSQIRRWAQAGLQSSHESRYLGDGLCSERTVPIRQPNLHSSQSLVVISQELQQKQM
jgi:hypothetical protein